MQLGTAGRRHTHGGTVSASMGYSEYSRGTPSTHRGALSAHLGLQLGTPGGGARVSQQVMGTPPHTQPTGKPRWVSTRSTPCEYSEYPVSTPSTSGAYSEYPRTD
jgi:hypothetical protein